LLSRSFEFVRAAVVGGKVMKSNSSAEVVSGPARVRFVSVEAGAGAFDAVPPAGVEETVLVAQGLDEPASTFAVRAVEHVAAIERSGRGRPVRRKFDRVGERA
jgi:hypothetical protein